MGGGGGEYYERDVTDKVYRSSSSGVSSVAEQVLSRAKVDKSLLPKNRRLFCNARNPLAYLVDLTGSMARLPKIIFWDKWPGIVGQVVARKYLPEPEMSIAGVGDITCDDAPVQVADFMPLRNQDKNIKKIYFEAGGGSDSQESYEFMAYFYAYLCEMPNAEIPICLITGDEGFRDQLYAADLKEHFGGQHQDTTAKQVFADLIKKFKGNVFLIHRKYGNSENAAIVRQWENVLGKERIINLPPGVDGDLAVGDITLGVYAIVSGARTLEQYLEDMRTRPLDLAQNVKYEPQSEGRIRSVEKALQPLKDFKPVRSRRRTQAEKTSEGGEEKKKSPRRKPGGKTAGWKL